MNDMNHLQAIDHAIELCGSLTEFLLEHKGGHLVAGIAATASVLTYSDELPEKRLRSASDTFRNLFRGSGSFGDFVVWHEDESTRLTGNKRFAELEAQLWEIFNSV